MNFLCSSPFMPFDLVLHADILLALEAFSDEEQTPARLARTNFAPGSQQQVSTLLRPGLAQATQ